MIPDMPEPMVPLPHTPMPEWAVVLLAVIVVLALAALPVTLLVLYIRNRPDFTALGVKFKLDKTLKGKLDPSRVETVLRMWVTEMSGPSLFNALDVMAHLKNVVCLVRDDFLKQPPSRVGIDGEGARYTGITHSTESVEISAHLAVGEDGKVDILRTAFLYEILNVMLVKFKGWEMSFAESIVDPDNHNVIKHISDVDGDGDVDSDDVRELMDKRRVFDTAHKAAVDKIKSVIDVR